MKTKWVKERLSEFRQPFAFYDKELSMKEDHPNILGKLFQMFLNFKSIFFPERSLKGFTAFLNDFFYMATVSLV